MRLGYNTNGFAHHDLLDALEVLAAIGYKSVAITLDHYALNPFTSHGASQLLEVRDKLAALRMSSVIETGARFLLDRNLKHEPTLVSHDAAARRRRVDFLCRAIDVAAKLQSDCISFWSGIVRDGCSQDTAWRRLLEGLVPVLDYADRKGVVVGFEPEPGMLIDTMDRYKELVERLQAQHLQLTLDVGHLHCQGETPIPDVIRRWRERLVNVHLEDMRAGTHEHLMFGEGEMDFPPILAALREVGYSGGVHVELSRHSHEAPSAAEKSWRFLAPMISSNE